jgi:aminocarboxymuconate-semialdehyde decarboxylase
VFSTPLLHHLVDDVGVEHVMLGTDHPFELGDRTHVETVTALGLDAQATRAILWDNATGLLKMT